MLTKYNVLRKYHLLYCSLLSVAFISCKKDAATEDQDNKHGNPTSYLLEQISYEQPGGAGGTNVNFLYNQDIKVSEVQRIGWFYVTHNNNPPVREETLLSYKFEYVNHLPVRCTLRDGLAWWTFDYEYAGDNIVKKTIRYANGSEVQDSTLYKYDLKGNLTEAAVYKEKIRSKDEYLYETDAVSKIHYFFDALPAHKSKTVYSGFDKRINVIRTANGLPKMFLAEEFPFLLVATLTSTNATQSNYSALVGINEDFGRLKASKFEYKYNEEGLPTALNHGLFTDFFKYRKIK